MGSYKLPEGWYEEDYFINSDIVTGVRLRTNLGFGFGCIYFYNGHIYLPKYYHTQFEMMENLKWLINKYEVNMGLKPPSQRVPVGFVEEENKNQLTLGGNFLSYPLVILHKNGGLQKFKCKDENYKYYPPEQIFSMLNYVLKTKEKLILESNT
jgi:hypothetical protein